MRLNDMKIWNDVEMMPAEWVGSSHEKIKLMKPAKVGSFGEKLVRQVLTYTGHSVEDRLSKGHDLIVNGKRVEVKTSSRNAVGGYIVNQLRPEQDYEELIFFFIKPEGYTVWRVNADSYKEADQVEGLQRQHANKADTLMYSCDGTPADAELIMAVNY